MSTVKAPLAFLWTANFEDGTELVEPKNDHYSKHDPKAESNPSAFRDVLDKEKESRLLTFHLTNVKTGDNIGVDLETGQFGINGIAFEAHPQLVDLTGKELQLIFFREVRIDRYMGNNTGKDEGSDHYINRYFIGWQIKGSSVQQTVAVS